MIDHRRHWREEIVGSLNVKQIRFGPIYENVLQHEHERKTKGLYAFEMSEMG